MEQALVLERVLPACIRQIFAVDANNPLSDLPFGQYRLCALLFREGKRTMSQVSDDLSISVSAVTQMADRLEKAGLVERVSETGGDRRTRYLQLTSHGMSLMQSRLKTRLSRATAALRKLTPEERQSVLDVLEMLRAASRDLGPPVPVMVRDERENR